MKEKFKNIFNVNYSVNRFQSHWFNSNITTITPLLIIIIIIIIVSISGLSYLVFTLTNINSATCSGTPTASTASRTLFNSFSILTMNNQINENNNNHNWPIIGASNLLQQNSQLTSANTSIQPLLLLPSKEFIAASSFYSLPSWNGQNSGKLKLRTRRSRANTDDGHSISSLSTSTNSDITTDVALLPSEATSPKQTYNDINEQYSYFNGARQYHSGTVSTSSSSLSTVFVSDDRNNIVIDDNNSAFNLPKPQPLQQVIEETDEQSEQEKQIIRTARHRHKNSEKDFGKFSFVYYLFLPLSKTQCTHTHTHQRHMAYYRLNYYITIDSMPYMKYMCSSKNLITPNRIRFY